MKLIPQSMTQKFGRQMLKARKGSPKALFILGIAGTITSTVLACRATLKLEETIDEFKSNIDAVKSMDEEATDPRWSRNREMARTYLVGTGKLLRLYGPAVLVGSASIGALTSSHVTLSRRNAGLTAAYSALQMSFDAYQQRVADELGEERANDLRRGVSVHMKEDAKGKPQAVKVVDPNGFSVYAKVFDEHSINWKRNAEENRVFLTCQQNYANHLLHARGHIFLNEVYDMLGFKHTSAGQVVGWVIGDEGDNFVDFGLYEACTSDFINGYEQSIVLDFNVDGVVWDKIEKN